MEVFYRYAPFIQDYIFRSGWQSLRGVQNVYCVRKDGSGLLSDPYAA